MVRPVTRRIWRTARLQRKPEDNSRDNKLDWKASEEGRLDSNVRPAKEEDEDVWAKIRLLR